MDYKFEQVKIVGGIGADDEFWRGLERGEFCLPTCASCNTWMWPAHFRCGSCGAWEMRWNVVEPKGKIFTWTRSWYAFDRVSERAEDVPYVSAVVEIPHAGGARVMGMFDGTMDGLNEDPRIGTDVVGHILPPSEKTKGYPSIVWRPVASGLRA
ncbi:Zn-ribbon domain-containing OB-fold protein [Sphingopyxis yananensis]|uniref:Zn-ribbon domain-containing OB-fold protein n=1 Tax=Sphingopyxis yananensis TaxID=2886687 RepID=UPI001D10B0B7|nr:OB-fold domain-containing protein [Sphingopyxis yananensis]MCC2602388.1 OB-fold domain-containing protein [Sphingopyxis yananensis]